MLTLTGSRAMKARFPDARDPKGDWDYITPWPDEVAVPRADVFVDRRLGWWEWGEVATADELYTMKISHIFWEINGPATWDKHAADIVFLERKGCMFIRELYDILLPIWKERYKKNPTNLNQGKGDFFKDGVKRIYDHDSIHESIAYFERPLYERILQDGSDVMVDSSKFWAMDYYTKIKLVREEIYATALERILIPNDLKGSPMRAYRWALRRAVTSLFKGNWALFLAKNLDELWTPDVDYRQRHIENAHRLRPLEG